MVCIHQCLVNFGNYISTIQFVISTEIFLVSFISGVDLFPVGFEFDWYKVTHNILYV